MEFAAMLKRLFGFPSRSNRMVVDALYGEIVAAARQPVLYSDWDVPDTPLGRYEMMALHLFLLLHRLRAEKGPVRDVAQELTDEFFKEVEHSIRELGVGDMGVPKRMKKLARMFYGRVGAYDAALNANDAAALAAALARNVRPDAESWPQAADLAAYAFAARDALARQPAETFVSGSLAFPQPGEPRDGEAA
jgi:cytochrome b pre-mRNA-processing protein 3